MKPCCRIKAATESKVASKQKFVGLYSAHSRCCLPWLHRMDRWQEIRVSTFFAGLFVTSDLHIYIAEVLFFLCLFTFLPCSLKFSHCVQCSPSSLRPVQGDAAFTARKIQLFKCNWCWEIAICALRLIIVEERNMLDHRAALISLGVMQTNSLRRRLTWHQDKCS